MRYWYFVALLAVLLSGCQSTKKDTEKPLLYGSNGVITLDGSEVKLTQLSQAIDDHNYKKALSRYRQSDYQEDAIKQEYLSLWHLYAQSSYLKELGDARDGFEARLAQIDSEQASCDTLDWQARQVSLFFSVDFNLKAQSCFESLGNTAQAEYFAKTVSFVLTGLFAASDGRAQYSALEVPSYLDADAIIALTGYEVVERFIDLGHNGAGLYYVFILNDPQSQEQFWLYFDYGRYLHQLAEENYPFGWMTDVFINDYVIPFAKTSVSFKIALARELLLSNQTDKAVEQLLEAAAQGSVIANYRLAEICRFRESTLLRKSDCFDFYLKSAEQGLAEGMTGLAYMLYEGKDVERDMAGFNQLMQAAEVKLPQGAAWFDLAQQANHSGNEDGYQFAAQKAADKGHIRSQYQFKLKQLQSVYSDEAQSAQSEQLLKQLYALASQDGDELKTLHAQLLLDLDSDTDVILALLSPASESGYPEAAILLGDMYIEGKRVDKDEAKAQHNYSIAAQRFDLDAQYKLGMLYNQGRLANRNVAAAWFRMCRYKSDLSCFFRMALAARDGYIEGMGIEQALNFFNILVEQQHPGGTITLAEMYDEQGQSYSDKTKAYELTLKAAALKVPWAYYRLCRYYAQGSTDPYVPMSVKKAKEYCEMASNSGIKPAKELLNTL